MDKATASNMHDALTAISAIDNSDALARIYDEVRARIRKQREAAVNRIGWRIGMKVKLKAEHANRKPYDADGVVEKVNPKKLKVRYDNVLWTIPKEMLDVVE